MRKRYPAAGANTGAALLVPAAVFAQDAYPAKVIRAAGIREEK